jgi:hypothetical protein
VEQHKCFRSTASDPGQPHDPAHHYWLVDDGAHAIFKFTKDGKQLVQTIGTPGVPGNDQTHFSRPTDIVWMADGTFFVSDGYTNTRVVKFDKNGKFVTQWGTDGKGRDDETRPYLTRCTPWDRARNRPYVSDREHSRSDSTRTGFSEVAERSACVFAADDRRSFWSAFGRREVHHTT